jgi:hypothetical protein
MSPSDAVERPWRPADLRGGARSSFRWSGREGALAQGPGATDQAVHEALNPDEPLPEASDPHEQRDFAHPPEWPGRIGRAHHSWCRVVVPGIRTPGAGGGGVPLRGPVILPI